MIERKRSSDFIIQDEKKRFCGLRIVFMNMQPVTGFSRILAWRLVNMSRSRGDRRSLRERLLRLEDLRAPRGDRLEAIGGNRKGQSSIRINDRYSVCLNRKAKGPADVEITGYR
jgi:proteic killer suppression protein